MKNDNKKANHQTLEELVKLPIEELKDYGYCEAAIRKTKEAKEFLEKHPVPEELLKIRDAQ